MAQNKTTTWTNVQKEVNELLEANKTPKGFAEALMSILEANLAPKSASSINPPKEIDGVIHYYCRFHQTYYTEDKMVMSAGKSKGYSKAAISKWNATNAQIKKLDSEAVNAMANGDFEKAQEIAIQAKELKDNFNKPEFYNAEEDNAKFYEAK